VNQNQPGKGQVRYTLGHELGTTKTSAGGNLQKETTRYATTPIEFDRPATGTKRMVVKCQKCRQQVSIEVLSPGAVTRERVKSAAYAVLTMLIFIAVAGLVPWDRLVGSANAGMIRVIVFFVFGIVAVDFGSRVFKPDAALAVRIVAEQGSHSILRTPK
jgi:hypothetical protein